MIPKQAYMSTTQLSTVMYVAIIYAEKD
jgi:hypothetical protein